MILKLFQYRICLFLIIVCFCSSSSFSQVKETKKDSTEIYSKIKSYTKKHKFTNFFNQYLFRSVSPLEKAPEVIKKKDTVNYNGKIIRKITIVTLDPFGFSEIDSTATAGNWGERLGNRMHLKTKRFVIKNLLLFKKNTPYNAYKIQESERIIRSQQYINAVKITGQLPNVASDSIDVTVRVLDSWNYIPNFSVSTSEVSGGLRDKNFFGIGQQLEYDYTRRFNDKRNAENLTYTIPNIKNSFISATALYNRDLDGNYNKSVAFGRPFYSTLAKWAGGAYFGQQFYRGYLQGTDSEYAIQDFKYNLLDVWLGKSFSVFKNNKRKTNLILSGRFSDTDYIDSPALEYDPVNFYSSRKLFLAGIGINTRGFVKKTYIFRNGTTEDVPTGRVFGITAGYQFKNTLWRTYAGAKASFGNFYKWGFLSADFEFGSFFDQSKTYQTAFVFEANYFTHLLKIGGWRVRQFVKPTLTIGTNRENSIADKLQMNGNSAMRGFDSAVYGNSRVVLSLQTQTYAPHMVLGFHLNPFFNYSVGMLGNANTLLQNKVRSKITFGILITNDYLVFSSFQISISYFPSIPLEGNQIFKTNKFQTTDLGLQTFELGRPHLVDYQ